MYDIDQLYNQSRKSSDDTILSVSLRGSFLTQDLSFLARHYLAISAVLKNSEGAKLLGQVRGR